MDEDRNKSKRSTEGEKLPVFLFGGREIMEGDSFSPEEAEELIRQLIEQIGGPVTIEDVNESLGTTVRSTVDDWAEFEQGPILNESQFTMFQCELVQKGYLAFEQENGSLRYHTAFRVLKPHYFADFQQFVRCQDIPESYFDSVIPGKSWFVSHRWATPSNPDPSGTQFEIVREFVHRNKFDGIWYDYSCMPQEPHSINDRELFDISLKHMNSLIITMNFMSIESDDYLSRAWCFYERIMSELLCCFKRLRIAPRNSPRLSDETINKFVIEGQVPSLKAEKSSDIPLIEDLLKTGCDMFKMLAVSTTFSLLNLFGFQFGVGTAARFSQIIDFEKLWKFWQVLAGSSEGSGIRLPHLLNATRLHKVLTRRHERFGTHVRFFSDLPSRMNQQLDMRIVEQESLARLATLMDEVSQSGPVPEAYTKLALIQLVYKLADRGQQLERMQMKNTEKQRNPPLPRLLCKEEVLVIFALYSSEPEIDDSWFQDVFQDLASKLVSKGVWFGSWKVLRVPNLKIELPNTSGEGMKLPSLLLDELRNWNSKQHKSDLLRIIGIRKFTDNNCYALVIHTSEN